MAPERERYPLCRELTCRWAFEQAAGLPPVEFQRQLQWWAQTWRAGRVQIERRARFLRERREADARQAAAVFAALGQQADLQLVIPTGHRRQRPLPKRRRQAHAAHLDAVIATALEVASRLAPAVPPPPVDPEFGASGSRLPGRLCGECGGGCCHAGGAHAYLSETTIRRVMAADPSLDPAGVRALYLGHLARRTIPGSCVHHTRHGCSLPRPLRSDICNTWVCDPLARLEAGLKADPPVREAVVLRRRQNQWNQGNLTVNNDIVAGAVVTETRTRRLKPPKPGGWTVGRAEDPQ